MLLALAEMIQECNSPTATFVSPGRSTSVKFTTAKCKQVIRMNKNR